MSNKLHVETIDYNRLSTIIGVEAQKQTRVEIEYLKEIYPKLANECIKRINRNIRSWLNARHDDNVADMLSIREELESKINRIATENKKLGRELHTAQKEEEDSDEDVLDLDYDLLAEIVSEKMQGLVKDKISELAVTDRVCAIVWVNQARAKMGVWLVCKRSKDFFCQEEIKREMTKDCVTLLKMNVAEKGEKDGKST